MPATSLSDANTTMKHRFPLLLAGCLLALLPVMLLRDFTPSNELRYLSIADEALREGHLFTFTFQGEPYADKPPLYLWLVMLGRLLFGQHQMLYLALLALLPAMVILATMERWLRTVVERRNRMTAALMLMTSGLFLGLAVCVRMDMLMCMFITLALYSFWQLYTGTGSKRLHRTLFALFTWLALFTKGPVGLLVPLLSATLFLLVERKPRLIARCCGWYTWGIIAGCSALWFLAVWLEGGSEYLNNLLFHQTIDRAVDAFHHKEPFWYYLVSYWYSLAPWSLLIAGIILTALVRRMRMTDLERLFLTVIVSTLVMLSLFSSKLAVYLAPTFPFFVYLAASLAQRMPPARWMKATVALPALIWCAALPAAVVLRQNADLAFLGNGWCLAATALLTAAGIAALTLLWREQTLRHAINTLAAGLLAALFVGGMALPRLNTLLGYGTMCRQAVELARTNGMTAYYSWEVRRPESMDAYLGAPVRAVTTDEVLAGEVTEGILMLAARKLEQDDAMQRFLAGKRLHPVGEYLLVEITPADTDTAEPAEAGSAEPTDTAPTGTDAAETADTAVRIATPAPTDRQ